MVILAFKFAINQEILSTWKLINLEYFADMNNEKKLKKLKAGLLLLSRDREVVYSCLLYTSPSPRDRQKSRMPSSA